LPVSRMVSQPSTSGREIMNDQKVPVDCLHLVDATIEDIHRLLLEMKEIKEDLLDKPPTKILAIPAVLESCGWVRKKEWVGLTDEDVEECIKAADYKQGQYRRTSYWAHLVVSIEAKLKEKNT